MVRWTAAGDAGVAPTSEWRRGTPGVPDNLRRSLRLPSAGNLGTVMTTRAAGTQLAYVSVLNFQPPPTGWHRLCTDRLRDTNARNDFHL